MAKLSASRKPMSGGKLGRALLAGCPTSHPVLTVRERFTQRLRVPCAESLSNPLHPRISHFGPVTQIFFAKTPKTLDTRV